MELRQTDVTRIAHLRPLPEISYDDYGADDESDDLVDLCGAEDKPPVSLEQTEFSLKQSAKRIGQANYCTVDMWNRVGVAGILERKLRSIICWKNCL